jgi:hypothetical protein
MNTLTLDYHSSLLGDWPDQEMTIEPSLKIDGKECVLWLSTEDLLRSLTHEGEHWINTCHCGYADCAGIMATEVNITHDVITWRIPKRKDRTDENPIYEVYHFDRATTIREVSRGIREAQTMIRDSIYPVFFEPYGPGNEGLFLELNPPEEAVCGKGKPHTRTRGVREPLVDFPAFTSEEG